MAREVLTESQERERSKAAEEARAAAEGRPTSEELVLLDQRLNGSGESPEHPVADGSKISSVEVEVRRVWANADDVRATFHVEWRRDPSQEWQRLGSTKGDIKDAGKHAVSTTQPEQGGLVRAAYDISGTGPTFEVSMKVQTKASQ